MCGLLCEITNRHHLKHPILGVVMDNKTIVVISAGNTGRLSSAILLSMTSKTKPAFLFLDRWNQGFYHLRISAQMDFDIDLSKLENWICRLYVLSLAALLKVWMLD